MERLQGRLTRKSGSLVFCSLILLLATSQAHSTIGTWICGDGNWEDSSCWSYTDTPPGDPGPFTPDMINNARLLSSDDTDRTVTLSSLISYDTTGTTIDATGSGTMTLVQTGGYLGISVQQSPTLVGVSGTGALIQMGGTIGGNLRLGVNAGSSGSYDLIGGHLGSEWSLTAGESGKGLVNQSGGSVSVGQLRVGDNVGGSGTYNLTDGILNIGYNTVADISWIGRAGTGTFNQSGGSHRAETGMIIGATNTGEGSYNLSAGEVDAGSFLIVGDAGTGTFEQTGGTVSANGRYNDYYNGPGGIYIGNGSSGNGTYNLRGGSLTGSGWNNGVDVTVGNQGTGVFNQSGGSFDITTCSSPSGCMPNSGNLIIGQQAGSTGAYNLSGGSANTNGVEVGVGGYGEFNQSGGTNKVNGTLAVANDSQGGSGVYTLSGGTLDAQQIEVNTNGTFNFDGGSITTDQFINGGTLSLGNTNADTAIAGNFFQLSSGILEVGASYSFLNGFTNSSLDVSQTATLGGTLDVSLDLNFGRTAMASQLDGFARALLQFDVLSADTILGEFDALELPDLGALDPFFDWQVSYILDDFGMDYVRVSMVSKFGALEDGEGTNIAHTPEPSTLLLMVSGLAGMGFSRRLKKRA